MEWRREGTEQSGIVGGCELNRRRESDPFKDVRNSVKAFEKALGNDLSRSSK